MDTLPNLCVVHIAELICETTDVVTVARTVAALSNASMSLRHGLGRAMRDIVDPPNDYDRLVVDFVGDGKRRKKASVADLKAACAKHNLAKSGTAEQLRDRLRGALRRGQLVGFSRPFVCKVRAELDRRARDAAAAAAEERRVVLTLALAARGCELRSDSVLCRRFIQGDSTLTMEDVVDETEEIRFFYNETEYPRILQGMRRDARGERDFYDREFERDFGSRDYWRRRERYRDGLDSDEDSDEEDEEFEENLRKSAKDKALRIWRRKNSTGMRLPAKLFRRRHELGFF